MFFLIVAIYFTIKALYHGIFDEGSSAPVLYAIYQTTGLLFLGVYEILEELRR